MIKEFKAIGTNGNTATIVIRITDSLILSVFKRYEHRDHPGKLVEILSFDEDQIHCRLREAGSLKRTNVNSILFENGKFVNCK